MLKSGNQTKYGCKHRWHLSFLNLSREWECQRGKACSEGPNRALPAAPDPNCLLREKGGGRRVPPGRVLQGVSRGSVGGGRTGHVPSCHPRHTKMSVCVASAGRGTVRMGSGCQPPRPEVGVAQDKAQGSRSCGFLSLSSLSSSSHLSPSIFHKSHFPVLPQQPGERRWGDHQGARCSAAQLDEKGSAGCCGQLQLQWPQPGLPSARGAFQALSSLAQVIKPNPFPWMRQTLLGTEQSRSGCETALCDALQSITRTWTTLGLGFFLINLVFLSSASLPQEVPLVTDARVASPVC